MNLLQAAVEAVKSPGILQGGIRTLVDGTVIVGVLKVVEALIAKSRARKAKTRERFELVQPAPKPGESDTCKKHLEQIEELQGKVEDHGKSLAGLAEFKVNTGDGMKRIETKIDTLTKYIMDGGKT